MKKTLLSLLGMALVCAASAPTGEVHTLYYAKGVGLVHQEFFNGVLPHAVLTIRRWMVN